MELSQEIALGLEQDVVSFSKCFMADGLGDVTFSRAGWSCNKDGVFFFDKSASGDIHDEGDRDFVIEGEAKPSMVFSFRKDARRSLVVNFLFPVTPSPGIAALTSSSASPRRYAPEQGTVDPTALVGCPQASLLPSAVLAGQCRDYMQLL